MKTSRFVQAGVFSLALLSSSPAWALSCDEIMNMVNVNVPANIIVQTMESSGEVFTSDAVRCLVNNAAPKEIVDTAKKMSASAQPADTEIVREDEPEVKKPSSGGGDTSFEDEERIGEKRTKKDSFEDLPEEGEEKRTSKDGCGRQIEEAVDLYKAAKPLASSKVLFDLAEGGTCPNDASEIYYYLGRSLYELQMYHSAQYYFMQVVKKGPSDRFFDYALPKVVAIARLTGDDSELLRIVHKIPPDEYPRAAKNYLNYLMGVRLYDEDNLNEARRYFAQISTKSGDLYLKSKYFEGVIFNRTGKLKSAVKAFGDVVRDAKNVDIYTEQELAEVQALEDLALINVARIYYGIQRFDESSRYYSLVPRSSDYWPQALFEAAWANFMQNDLNLTLGQVLTVHSPFYAEDEFIPEATILRALTFFNLCEYSQVERELLAFEAKAKPMQDELKDFVKQYSTPEGKKLADQAFDAYFGGVKKETVLPKSMFLRFLRNQDLLALVKHLQMMEDEEKLINAQKSLWLDSVGAHLKNVFEEDRRRYKQRAGLVLLSEMARMSNYLGDLLTQSQIIRFEVVSAQRSDYQYKVANTDLAETTNRDQVDFATDVNFIFWPFNGEFWVDELGFYYYTEQGSCK